jgi:hypothetical protein
MAMRQGGHSFDEIAQAFGVANRSVAAKMVSRASRRNYQELVDAWRARTEDQLLTIELNLFAHLMSGRLSDREFHKTIRSYVKVSRQRSRLLGLYPRPGIPHPVSDGELWPNDWHDPEFSEMVRIALEWWSQRGSAPDPMKIAARGFEV